ncbi:UNVERIFIED_CONTAM: hypothetical protein RMT77_009762 [Armadillidium vulgare]
MTSSSWKRLNGVFCIYKPALKFNKHVCSTLKGNLVADLNKEYVPKEEKLVTIQGNVGKPLKVKVEQKYAVHPLALGQAYQKEDIKLSMTNNLDFNTSGVCLVGIGRATKLAHFITFCRLIRTYRLSGVLGKATLDFHISSKVIEKSKYAHVTSRHLDKVLMMIQAIHQKRGMESLGMNLQSQGAFEALAEEGIVRPGRDSYFLLYAMKRIEFDPPNFTIEVSCINEYEENLRKLLHEIGLLLKTNATTSKIHCIRYGPFTVDDALLAKHWRLEHINDNIDYLRDRVKALVPESPSLQVIEETESSM